MKVTLRKRNRGGKTSLFLDFTINGKRTKEYLQLYLEENNPTKEQKESNKKTMDLAEAIRSQRQLEIQSGTYGFINPALRKADFVKYFEELKEKRFESRGELR